jgi:hypothetical protein
MTFAYKMKVKDGVDPSTSMSGVENRLTGQMSRDFLADCSYSSASAAFHVKSASSLPADSIDETQNCGENCSVIKGGTIIEYFYHQRRQLLTATIEDQNVVDVFGPYMTSLFQNSEELRGDDIESLVFVGFTNVASAGDVTFGGVDPNVGDDSGVSGIARESSPGDDKDKEPLALASIGIAFAAILLVAVTVMAARRRRRRRRRKTLMKRTSLEEDSQLYTYDDSIGLRQDVDGMSMEDSEVSTDGRVYVLGDHASFNTSRSQLGLEMAAASRHPFQEENNAPPMFLPVQPNRPKQYDPYEDRLYTMPDTMEL